MTIMFSVKQLTKTKTLIHVFYNDYIAIILIIKFVTEMLTQLRMHWPEATKLSPDLTQCYNHLRTILLSVNMDVMSGNLKISLRLTHIFVVYNAIPTCVLG